MLQGITSSSKKIEDESIVITQKSKNIDSGLFYTFFSNTYISTQRSILNSLSIQRKIKDIEFSDFMASLAILDSSSRQQIYTNPILQQIGKKYLFVNSIAAEASNFAFNIVNGSVIDFVNNLVNCLNPIYSFHNPAEVIKFLKDNKYLVFFLMDANKKIKEVFPQEKLQLSVVSDPEIKYWKRLIINIHTLLDVDEAFDRLKILDDIWWLDASSLVSNDLDITINFDEI